MSCKVNFLASCDKAANVFHVCDTVCSCSLQLLDWVMRFVHHCNLQ